MILFDKLKDDVEYLKTCKDRFEASKILKKYSFLAKDKEFPIRLQEAYGNCKSICITALLNEINVLYLLLISNNNRYQDNFKEQMEDIISTINAVISLKDIKM